jgi:3-oxoacyl-[acyl-carrier-protein] synthase III
VAFDISAACTGFIYGVSMAEGYLAAGRGEVALVVSTEKMSAILDWEDRSTAVLFGDGAAAAVLRRSDGEHGILSSHLRSDGNLAELLYRPAGGALEPMSQEVLAGGAISCAWRAARSSRTPSAPWPRGATSRSRRPA